MYFIVYIWKHLICLCIILLSIILFLYLVMHISFCTGGFFGYCQKQKECLCDFQWAQSNLAISHFGQTVHTHTTIYIYYTQLVYT